MLLDPEKLPLRAVRQLRELPQGPETWPVPHHPLLPLPGEPFHVCQERGGGELFVPWCELLLGFGEEGLAGDGEELAQVAVAQGQALRALRDRSLELETQVLYRRLAIGLSRSDRNGSRRAEGKRR